MPAHMGFWIAWAVLIGLIAYLVHVYWPWTWTGKKKYINIRSRHNDWGDD